MFNADDLPLISFKNVIQGLDKQRIKRKKTSRVKIPRDSVENTEKANERLEKTNKYNEIISTFMPILPCDLCEENVSNFQEMRVHFSNKHSHKKPHVKCCKNIFYKHSTLAEHIQWHRDPNTFKYVNFLNVIICIQLFLL